MDPLSDVLSLLKPRSYGCGSFDVGGELSVGFPQHDGIKCYSVVRGKIWLAVDGVPNAVQLSAGDCFVLPAGPPFRLTTDLTLASIDFRQVLGVKSSDNIKLIQGGGGCLIVGGHFALDGKHADILLSVLPTIVHIQSEADKAVLRWSLDRLMQELREPQPGSDMVIEHLVQMMLVHAIRLHLVDGQAGRIGWLFALADKQMGLAIGAMHGDPARRWTLQSLAQCAGMSRTSFAQKFKATVGTSPMDYLTRWRMLLAANRLINSGDAISVIGLSLGYESESAFRRVMRSSPRQYGGRRTSNRSQSVADADEKVIKRELVID